MSQKQSKKPEWASASCELKDALTGFILSRQAMFCTVRTIEWYSWTLGKFAEWLEVSGVLTPDEITARVIRTYLAELRGRNLSDSYIHNHARAIRTFTRFLHAENYIESHVNVLMPKIGKKKLPVLTAREVKRVISSCMSQRDKALIMFMVDTGIRRNELCSLTWGDVEISRGLVSVLSGKGRKYRPVIVGTKTRREIIKYRRAVSHFDTDPLIQIREGKPFIPSGLRSCLLRISERVGVRISPQILRRTFATLSIKGDMDISIVSRLMGHASVKTKESNLQLIEADLVEANSAHGPVDKFL